MENIDHLALLEKAVTKLMNSVGELKKEKMVLEARLESRDLEIAELKKGSGSWQQEREEVQKRVSSLLKSIEKWEKLNESGEEAHSTSKVVEEKTLF